MTIEEMLASVQPPTLGFTLVLPPEGGRSPRFEDRLKIHEGRVTRNMNGEPTPAEGSAPAREGARQARLGGAPGIDRSPMGKGDQREGSEMPQGFPKMGSGFWRS